MRTKFSTHFSPRKGKTSIFKLKPRMLFYCVLKAELTGLSNHQTDQCMKTFVVLPMSRVAALAHCSFSISHAAVNQTLIWKSLQHPIVAK